MEIDNYSPVLETVDDRIEAIEEKVTKHPKPELLTRVLKLKRLLPARVQHISSHRRNERQRTD